MRRQILRAAVRGGVLLLVLVFTQFAQAQTETAWTQLSPAAGPPSGRLWHSAVYDPATNRMAVFGGRTGSGIVNDVWVLTDANGLGGAPTWMQLSPAGGPPSARVAHTGIYDPGTNRLVVFGGQADTGFVNDVWVLTDANGLGGAPTWMQLSPTGGPPSARYLHSAIYDPANNRMIVFGGFADGFVNDVWVLTDANGLGGAPTWMQLSPAGGPPSARFAHSAVYDPATNRMIVFGGLAGSGGSANDVWVLTNANGLGGLPTWTQLSPAGGPPSARFAHSAVYDPGTNRLAVFGGQVDSAFVNDVWVLTNANGLGGSPTWIPLSPAGGSLSPRYGHSAIYDSTANRMTAFGGLAGTVFANDVWVLANATGNVEPVVVVVAIDIKPGSTPNSINPGSHGTIPVAVLSAADFIAPAVVDPASLTFGRTGTEATLAFCNGKSDDVNGDGLPDLICHFFTEGTGFQAGDAQGVLRGKTLDGQVFEGTDSVRIIN